MCIIACKPAGVAFPGMDTLKNCWDNNPHGAGVAWQAGKSARIEKGMMTWDVFEAFIEKLHRTIDPTTTAVMYHFRITSRGETTDAQTHPYPLSRNPEDMKRLSLRTRCAVMHNGTMPIASYKGMNDTQTFVLDYLTRIESLDADWVHNKEALALIESITDSKMAFLKGNEIVTVGKFTKEAGMLYSNDGYLDARWSYGYGYGYGYGYDSPSYLGLSFKLAKLSATELASYAAEFKSKMRDELRLIRAYAQDATTTRMPVLSMIDDCYDVHEVTGDEEFMDMAVEAELALGWGTGKAQVL